MALILAALSSPNSSSRKSSDPRPFTLPSLAFFNIVIAFILKCSLLYSHLRTRTLLYLLFPLLVVDLHMYRLPCYTSVPFTINRQRTEKFVVVSCNLSALPNNENPSQPSLPDSGRP